MSILSFVYEKLASNATDAQHSNARMFFCFLYRASAIMCLVVHRVHPNPFHRLQCFCQWGKDPPPQTLKPTTNSRAEGTHSLRSGLFTIHKVGHCSVDCALSSAAHCDHSKTNVCPFVSAEQTRFTDEETTKELSEFKGAVQQHPFLLCLLAREQQCGAAEVTWPCCLHSAFLG